MSTVNWPASMSQVKVNKTTSGTSWLQVAVGLFTWVSLCGMLAVMYWLSQGGF
jgi:hypothetical protein